jgi:hypothetical protein
MDCEFSALSINTMVAKHFSELARRPGISEESSRGWRTRDLSGLATASCGCPPTPHAQCTRPGRNHKLGFGEKSRNNPTCSSSAYGYPLNRMIPSTPTTLHLLSLPTTNHSAILLGRSIDCFLNDSYRVTVSSRLSAPSCTTPALS